MREVRHEGYSNSNKHGEHESISEHTQMGPTVYNTYTREERNLRLYQNCTVIENCFLFPLSTMFNAKPSIAMDYLTFSTDFLLLHKSQSSESYSV